MKGEKMKYLDDLNPQQKEAVLHEEGPLLILAGAGSGKTRTVTYRIAHLIRTRKLDPSEIFAVTFTNKAAKEMRERVEALLGKSARGMWISTFHSACARILRENIHHLGYGKNFNIIDSADSVNLIKSCMKDLNISERLFSPREMSSRISALKGRVVSADEFRSGAQAFGFDSKLAKVYPVYQDRLKASDALDFDDLLMQTALLFMQSHETLAEYNERFSHILVDEYQDTNPVQYRLIRMLAGNNQNICVVGDDDQSIYSFRGADLRNILEFEKDYPKTKVIKLEQNYRSTQRILDAAWSLVSKNVERKPKKLWTKLGKGDKVSYMRAPDEEAEAMTLAKEIKKLSEAGRPLSDCAVLYRTNTQARTIEESMRRAGLPYRVVGGMKFYDRKEIKDLISYLKVVCNPKDSVSLRRIVNTPPRGIGEATLKKAGQVSTQDDMPLVERLERLLDDDSLTAGPKKSIREFLDSLASFREARLTVGPKGLAEMVLASVKYMAYIKESIDLDYQGKLDNLKELIASIGDFEKTAEDPTLEGYLTQVSLVADWDSKKELTQAVTLMTMHLSKGLEFPVVFIAGVEEGLIPHSHSNSSDGELEEERRLLYVGMTRAKERLYLLNAVTRRLAGLTQSNKASRFLEDLEPEMLDVKKTTGPGLMRPTASANSCPTRAAILAAKPTADCHEPRSPFRTGATVSHPTWGRGVIEKMEGRGEDMKVIVLFKSAGRKKLMARFAGLTKA